MGKKTLAVILGDDLTACFDLLHELRSSGVDAKVFDGGPASLRNVMQHLYA
eukprot:NODE_5981_length_539_cov_29.728571_g5232_i0.p5 GENE.NODE_5981_length_539_cov_29.728571_g5232_i0~~NODE_5981_length_539_cov_29.728571_g5232_i0.p5  ORF type:complete len:51 (-),score=12.28 NODE_5981_length_539_cov_29.728571_g5232_i0:129-281(-)